MLPIHYLTEVADDLDVTFIEYEQRRPGLGERFLAAVRQRVDVIQASPALYGEAYPSICAAPVRRFPYIVYYRIEPSHILVIAVRHGHDDPAVWQTRS